MKAHWRPGSLRGVDGVAEAVAARDLNHLYRTSCYFSERSRYTAFCTMYAIMRVVDDRVDAARVDPAFTSDSLRRESRVVDAWARVVDSSLAGRSPSGCDLAEVEYRGAEELADALLRAAQVFPVPAVLWSNFFSAMRRDLREPRFTRFEEFIEYSEGAAVAPTTMYLYLIAAERQSDGLAYRVSPDCDVVTLGRALGRFAYLAHVLRDLRQDLESGDRGLLYLAADDMARHGVSESRLAADVASHRASPPVRALVRELVGRAWRFLAVGRTGMRALERRLSQDRAFVLGLIVRTYEEVLKKIVACSYDPISGSHRLTETDKRRIALQVASR